MTQRNLARGGHRIVRTAIAPLKPIADRLQGLPKLVLQILIALPWVVGLIIASWGYGMNLLRPISMVQLSEFGIVFGAVCVLAYLITGPATLALHSNDEPANMEEQEA